MVSRSRHDRDGDLGCFGRAFDRVAEPVALLLPDISRIEPEFGLDTVDWALLGFLRIGTRCTFVLVRGLAHHPNRYRSFVWGQEART